MAVRTESTVIPANRRLWLPVLTVATIALFMLPVHASAETANNPLREKLSVLDEQFQVLSKIFYETYSPAKSLKALSKLTDLPADMGAIPTSKKIDIISRIKKHTATVCGQYTSAKFSDVLQLLYSANETATLRALSDCINHQGDGVAKTENYFYLAKYYYARENWPGVFGSLKKINPKDLSVSDADYVFLLEGYALQAKKKHRDAAKLYKKVPVSSAYYAHAKLNQGLAYLRQGWWSDAYRELELAITHSKNKEAKEFHNRTLVVLGFAQLNSEFYRHARDTLRRVSLSSAYTNKALLGLGVAAAYQKDYPAALNAFNRLASGSVADLNLDESFLLVPHTHEELGDLKQAEVAYRRAIGHYIARLKSLNNEKRLIENTSGVSLKLLESLNKNSAQLYGAKYSTPTYILGNYRMLIAFTGLVKNPEIAKRLKELKLGYEQVMKSLILDKLLLRESILTRYLSHAKYGVARLYDKP